MFQMASGSKLDREKTKAHQGPVVQRPINVNPGLKIYHGVSLSTPKADIRQNITLQEANLEKHK